MARIFWQEAGSTVGEGGEEDAQKEENEANEASEAVGEHPEGKLASFHDMPI